MGTFQSRNAWRIENAGRAAILIDAGAYFGAVREALLQAERNVFIIGWDLDSRTRLVGDASGRELRPALDRRRRRVEPAGAHRARGQAAEGRVAPSPPPSAGLRPSHDALTPIDTSPLSSTP